MIHKIANVGQIGVNKDLSQHELPDNAFTDAQNIRFLDGYAHQFLGYSEIYASPTEAPQYLIPVIVGGVRSWVYATAAKCWVASVSGGAVAHTDLTHDKQKCVDITNNRLRAERAPLLAELDVQVIRAQESGAETALFIAEKQRLRDITKLANPSMTLEELKALKA